MKPDKKTLAILYKFGIEIKAINHKHEYVNDKFIPTISDCQVVIHHERFDASCHLLDLINALVESDTPVVAEAFEHLLTLAKLTKQN